ncbi:MAG: di-heme oxidoredictase family protein [Acidobacteriota bacterium]
MELVKRAATRAMRPVLAAALAAGLAAATAAPGWPAPASPIGHVAATKTPPEVLSGGDTTVFDTGQNAFGRSLGNLEARHWGEMQRGKRLFVHRFQPSGNPGARGGQAGPSGLGPLFNADSCSACHFKDGRGRRPDDPAPSPPLIYRFTPESPAFGAQLQDRAVAGAAPEGAVEVTAQTVDGRYGDGSPFTLHEPRYRWRGEGPGPGVGWSARQPTTLVGLGLLEAVPDRDILAWSDETDRDGDGISGRPRWLAGDAAGRRLGRFGWRAEQASLRDQTAAALREDMGIRTRGASPELSADEVRLLVLYLQLLAPPARRDVELPAVRRGERLFARLGCSACHRPEMRTGAPDAIEGPAELAGQVIRPYTDLLLHDLGPRLADAGGAEWRTAPLWGLGLLETVGGELRLLHDGRARSFEEAILWHGGEAENARRDFTGLTAPERADLVRFLESL